MRLWRNRARRSERELEERGEEISRNLLERGLQDLDERSGLFGRLERRLLPKRERDRRDEL
jgi:hypothetical protein